MIRNTLLACRPVRGGQGVYALRAIRPGRRILNFSGPLLDGDAVESALSRGCVDVFLQIAEDGYLGPSGSVDDFVNHSCEPNCGLQFPGSRIVLTAIRPVSAGEEITFDYATTQNDYPFRFTCGCGKAGCRGDIGDFDDLPYSLKLKYYKLGVIAPYLAARFAVRAQRRAGPVAPEPVAPE